MISRYSFYCSIHSKEMLWVYSLIEQNNKNNYEYGTYKSMTIGTTQTSKQSKNTKEVD